MSPAPSSTPRHYLPLPPGSASGRTPRKLGSGRGVKIKMTAMMDYESPTGGSPPKAKLPSARRQGGKDGARAPHSRFPGSPNRTRWEAQPQPDTLGVVATSECGRRQTGRRLLAPRRSGGNGWVGCRRPARVVTARQMSSGRKCPPHRRGVSPRERGTGRSWLAGFQGLEATPPRSRRLLQIQ